MFVVVSYDIRSHVPLTCFHHYLLDFDIFIYQFLSSSHQLYAELWLDFYFSQDLHRIRLGLHPAIRTGHHTHQGRITTEALA